MVLPDKKRPMTYKMTFHSVAKHSLPQEYLLCGVSYFDKDLWPVFILFIGCHQEIAGQHRHQAIPFGFEIDGGISSQKAT